MPKRRLSIGLPKMDKTLDYGDVDKVPISIRQKPFSQTVLTCLFMIRMFKYATSAYVLSTTTLESLWTTLHKNPFSNASVQRRQIWVLAIFTI